MVVDVKSHQGVTEHAALAIALRVRAGVVGVTEGHLNSTDRQTDRQTRRGGYQERATTPCDPSESLI